MNLKNLSISLLKLTDKVEEIEKTIIFVFVTKMGYHYEKSHFFERYFHGLDNNMLEKVTLLFEFQAMSFDIYTLIELFELLIPSNESKENGIVYTPPQIKEYILQSVIYKETPPTICDPACGCGSFLLSAAELLNRKYKICFDEIFSNYIFGVDILAHNIQKCSILFHLLALTNNEVLTGTFNLLTGNSLEISWIKEFPILIKGGFDCVVGNPPYVRSRNIPHTTRESMGKWKTSSSGNVDLYIPFYELGYTLIGENGKLGYISPNTFLQSVNGRKLREFFKLTTCDLSILDFRETQVFKNVTSYTCIVLLDKSKKDGKINYALLNGKSSLYDYNFMQYNMEQFVGNGPWRLGEKHTDAIVKQIEGVGNKLADYKIRNGLATLKNDIFFFTPLFEDDEFLYRNYGGETFKIEKTICIDVAKPNTIKTEEELKQKMEKAIFPYEQKNGNISAIDENTMLEKFPHTYRFLISVKEVLLRRDKGNGKYPIWYAYGRSQGMANFGKKLLLPYISGSPVAVLSLNPNVLFYCGYAVFSDSEEELNVLKRLLESDVFWYYISKTSKPYSNGYMSFAKNYIKGFGIPLLTDTQKKKLLSLSSRDQINSYVKSLYGVEL